MRKLHSIICMCAAMLCVQLSFALTATVNDITWTYTVESGKASIGDINTPAVPTSTVGVVTIPSSLNGIPVTKIKQSAFRRCVELTGITIPHSVTTIEIGGLYPFGGCSRLTEFVVDSANTAYKSENGLLLSKDGRTLVAVPASTVGSLSIPTNVVGFIPFCFNDCSGLRSIAIPASVTEVQPDKDVSTFQGCSGLIEISVDPNNAFYKSECGLLLSKDGKTLVSVPRGLVGSLLIPDGVKNIGQNAFYDCNGLMSVTIPQGVANIDDSAFNHCSLTSVTIPNSVTNIGVGAFLLTGLKRVEIPNDVDKIRMATFSYCRELIRATIPQSVTNIEERAFAYSGLQVIVFEGNAPTMSGSDHFCDVPSTCTAYVIPGSKQWKITNGKWNGINIDYLKSVQFDANEGAVTADVRWFVPGDEVGVLPIPTRIGYAFDGWYTERNGGTKIDEMTTITTNTTFYAAWKSLIPVFNPVSGTTFDNSLSVSISCSAEGAIIYYTTDGCDPTVESSVYRRFRIYGKTTVKAIAEKDGVLSEVATAEYALGRCVDPIISPVNETEFAHSNRVVSIRWNNDGVLRYTLDGSDPTIESPVYEEPFTISDSAVVKAKVFSDDFFDSAVVTASLTRVWEKVATPEIEVTTPFAGSKVKVVISSATEGAAVRYTLDGSEPNSFSTLYTGAFSVSNSCTVKAYATKEDYLDSEVATQEIEKVWSIGDTLGKPDHGFATEGSGGGTGWVRVEDVTAPDGEAMKSGAITHNQSSVLSTTVTGPGALSFAWRTSCEDDPMFEWDHVEFVVDGTVVRKLCGETAWTNECVEIVGDNAHTIEWRYVKDNVESEGEDAAWVANYSWASAWTATRTTEVPVPYVWLDAHDPGVVDEYEAYEASAKASAVNGRKVWECYVLGLDPEVATNDFRITSFPMKADGTPDFGGMTVDPPPIQWNVPATWKVKGAVTLEGPWGDVPSGGNPAYRFFKVEVVLP